MANKADFLLWDSETPGQASFSLLSIQNNKIYTSIFQKFTELQRFKLNKKLNLHERPKALFGPKLLNHYTVQTENKKLPRQFFLYIS